LIDQFRQLVAERLGKLAVAILDQKLAGEDAKNLVGKAANGTPSAYYIRRETRAIKELAQTVRPTEWRSGVSAFGGSGIQCPGSDR